MTDKLTPSQDLHKVLKAFIERHSTVIGDGLPESKQVDMLEPQKYETMTVRETRSGNIIVEGTLEAGFTVTKEGEVWVWNERTY